jgi:hypothetical protein
VHKRVQRVSEGCPCDVIARQHAFVSLNPNMRVLQIGMTPLHMAAAAGAVETIQILLGYGADIRTRDMVR